MFDFKCGVSLALASIALLVPRISHAGEGSEVGEAEVGEAEVGEADSALELFETRIMPIFKSSDPSSCVQCHLSSVDLKDYILPSHTATFLALRDNGLVNVDRPAESKILQLIGMGDKDPDPLSRRLHQKTRKAEFEAFSAWIHACCSDEKLVALTKKELERSVGPERPLEVVRHARKSRVVESFAQKVWSQRMRCFPCHTPHEIDKRNPKHEKPAERHQELVKTYGARMNLFGRTPEETLAGLIASSRNPKGEDLPLINVKDPAKSLLVLKPTAKLPPKQDDGNFAKPSSQLPVSHMGGLKMHVDDHSYKMFLAWLQDYAAVVSGEYLTVEDLPSDNWLPTQRILRMKDVPQAWPVGSVVQLFVHTRSDDGQWSESPVAFTQGTVTPRRMVNGALLLFASRIGQENLAVDEEPFPLKPGDYLIKTFVDKGDRIAETPSALLGADDYQGQAVIAAQWQIGFPKAEVFSGDQLQR